jgi:hypothetical protein
MVYSIYINDIFRSYTLRGWEYDNGHVRRSYFRGFVGNEEEITAEGKS